MLVKLVVPLSIIVCILVSAMMSISIIWDKVHQGEILTAIIFAPSSNRYQYQLVDIRTSIHVTGQIPVSMIQDVLLHPNGQDMLVFSGARLERVRFYFFNVTVRELIHPPREFDVTSTSFDFAHDSPLLTVWSRLEAPETRIYYTIHMQTAAEQQSYQRQQDAVLLNLPVEIGVIRSTFPSPDGRWIAFMTRTRDTYTLNRETGEFYPLDRFHEDAEITTLDWSPDSRYIVFAAAASAVERSVYISDPTGDHRVRFELAAMNPTWSPDGRYIAVQTWANPRSFYIVPVSSAGEWLSSGHVLVENALGPQWSQHELTVVQLQGSRYQLLMIQPQSGRARTILSGTAEYPVSAFGFWR